MSHVPITKIRNCAVFAMSALPTREQEYLLAAAADRHNSHVSPTPFGALIRISDNEDENLYLHGTEGLQAMLISAANSGCRYFEVDRDHDVGMVVTHELPFGISIAHEQGGASISSCLASQFNLEDGTEVENAEAQAAADGMESLILALAAEGFNVSGSAFIRALETAVASTGENL